MTVYLRSLAVCFVSGERQKVAPIFKTWLSRRRQFLGKENARERFACHDFFLLPITVLKAQQRFPRVDRPRAHQNQGATLQPVQVSHALEASICLMQIFKVKICGAQHGGGLRRNLQSELCSQVSCDQNHWGGLKKNGKNWLFAMWG